MKKKSLKKTMVIALAGIMLAGSLGWSQIPARAAGNDGEVVCVHEKMRYQEIDDGYDSYGLSGHMSVTLMGWICCKCEHIVISGIRRGVLEAHSYDWIPLGDRGDGMYNFEVWCTVCGYTDEFTTDDPNDPHI